MAEEKLKLGEILVKAGAISLLDLETFLQEQEELRDERGYQTRLGSLLLEHKLVNEETLALAFSEQQSIEYQDLTNFKPDLNVLEKIPFSILSRFKFIPIFMDSERLVICIHDPIDTFLFDLLYKALGLHIEFSSSARSAIDRCHKESLQAISDSGRINRDFDVDFDEYRLILQQESGAQSEQERPEVSLLRSVRLLSLEEILKEAFWLNKAVALKCREDHSGISFFMKKSSWKYLGSCDGDHYEALTLRIKHYCKDTEFRQDLFSQYFIEVPCAEGQNLTLSVLLIPCPGITEILFEPYPPDPQCWGVSRTGLLSQEVESLSSLDLSSQGGWILGAASSGKSTFFQALLWDLVSRNQEPISFETGLSSESHNSWARVELDEEKNQLQAIMAYRGPGAGLVGIDELHPDEVGGYLRLLEGRPALITSQGGAIFSTLSGLEKQGIGLGYLLESMAFIISLKLVPGVCPYCCRPHNPQPEELRQIGLKPESLKKPYFVTNDGCEFCENRGYSESTLVYEFLRITPQVVKILQDNPLGNELAIHLIKLGALVPSNSVAREKLYRGRITLNTYAQILQRKI